MNAAAEYVDRTSAEVGGLIESQQIKEIPVSGRNWASLMLLAPGAVNYSDGSQRNIRFNGHSIDDSNYTFDGIDKTSSTSSPAINPVTGTRPLAGFSSFGFKTNDGNSNFNSLQASLERRFTRGLLFQGNYTYGHTITDASIGSGESVTFQNMGCRACDRSSASTDVRHIFTMNRVYQLPFARNRRLPGG